MASTLIHSSTLRLALIYMVLFGTSVLILLGFIYWSTVAFMVNQTDETIEAEIAGLAGRYELTGLAGLTSLITERLSRKPTGSSIYLLTTDTLVPLVGNLDRWPNVQEDAEGWLNFRLEQAGNDGADIHRGRARAFRLSGGFRLLVGRDVHELEKTRGLIIRTLVWGVVITLVLAGAGGTMMSRSMVRRIETINQTSREIMNGELSRRIPTRGRGDDFDVLAGNLNNMLDRIESLMEDVRRVSDNIAHDLRTPLARLRNRLELMSLQIDAGGEGRDLVEQAVAEADQLLSTFNSLMRIARAESAARREAFVDVDMEALVRDVVELYEPLAESRNQQLSMQLDPGAHTAGDRNLLFQAVANFLDNAIKYTPTGGRIRIQLDAEGLVIADSGPGIPAESREQVLKRFFRLEQSRSTPGNGLGLSLCAAVVKLHGMSLVLEDNRPGLRAVIRFAPGPDISTDQGLLTGR
mgnify:FL=1